MHLSLILVTLLAQSTPPTATPEAKARAQNLLKEGAKLYEKGALAPALDKFNEAYAEYQSPKLLFNIGQASRDLGRPAEAMSAFEHFLAEATDAPADMTAEAKRSVAELEGKLGKLRIQCEKAGAEISLDGRPVGQAPVTELIWAVPGPHQVTARHPTTAPAIEDVEVNAGWVHTVVMSLQPLPPPTATGDEPVPGKAKAVAGLKAGREVRPDRESVEAPKRAGRTWTWVAAGSAVLFAGTAVALGVSMQSKYSSLDKSCGSASGHAYPDCSQSQVDQVLLRKNLANVSWGLAAAAAATAGVLFFVEGRGVKVAPMAGAATGVLAEIRY